MKLCIILGMELSLIVTAMSYENETPQGNGYLNSKFDGDQMSYSEYQQENTQTEDNFYTDIQGDDYAGVFQGQEQSLFQEELEDLNRAPNTGSVHSVCKGKVADIFKPFADCVTESIDKTVQDTLRSLFLPLIGPGYASNNPASSCKEIFQMAPKSSSGLYWVRGTNNSPKQVYCDMERSCKGVAGGWMRVASIDMTDSKSTCPPGLRTVERSSKPNRLCAMSASGPSCSSTVFPLQGVQYSRVCGKIIGYQSGSPDAFNRFISGQNTLESNYVDGISLTHGVKPYKHIWTFAAAVHEHNSAPKFVCPCTNTRNRPPPSVPSFVGQNYFCDTGSTAHFRFVFYGDDPLWDGAGCGQFSTCCAFNSPPWFMREVSPTTDDIMMRLCTDQKQGDEDMNFETLEIYVQ